MKRAGVYMLIETGEIWLCEKVEHYEETENSLEFTVIVSGSQGGRHKIRRCLIRKKHYEFFKYIGAF